MKQYPSIPRQAQNIPVYAFDKLDGSNIRAEWNKKKGFHKFGSRTQLIDHTHDFLGEAPELVKTKYEQKLHDIFKKERFEEVVCFFEFYGPSSFAGTHKKDEEHTVTIFDIDVYKRGLMKPSDFLKVVGDLDFPKVAYFGNANSDFIEEIRDSKNEAVTFEGVVCKSNLTDKYNHPIMFKVKTKAWIDKLKNYCKGDDKLFEALA